MNVAKVEKAVDAQKAGMVKLLSDLLARNTANPPGNEFFAAEVVKEFFEREKIAYRIFEKQKGRSNIIGYIGKAEAADYYRMPHGHGPGRRGMASDPFRARVEGDKIYGRGAVDNKGPLAGMLIAGKILKKLEPSLRCQVMLACVADEEMGSEFGMRYLLDSGLDAEYAIVPDIEHELKKIDVAEKGLLFLKVTSLGTQAHGSTPEAGINAVWNMLEFLALLKRYKMRFKQHRCFRRPP